MINGIKLFFILKPSLRSLDPPTLWKWIIIKEAALHKVTGGCSEHELQRSLARAPGRVGSPGHSHYDSFGNRSASP